MPVEAHVQLDQRQLKEYEQALSAVKNGVPRVQSWAIQRTVSESRKRITRGLSAEIAVPQKKLYQRGSRRRPVTERITRRGSRVESGRVSISKGRLPLGRFTPRQHWKTKATGLTRGEGGRFQSSGRARIRTRVSYKIKKSGGRKKIRDAFLVEMPSGYEGIFRREGKKRTPLYELHGPSIPQVAERNAAVQNVLNNEAGQILLQKAAERTQYLLERV